MSTHATALRLAALAVLTGALAGDLHAANSGSGHFRMADNRQEYSHVVALSRTDAFDASKHKTYVYLTTHPVDPKLATGEFDIDNGITAQLREIGGGMTRITINADGSEGGLWFWSSEPSDTFNTSGFGEFAVTTNTAKRIEGRHRTPEPRDFFDKTYEFDLNFAADVVSADFSGDALPAGGGEPGKAWVAYLDAVRSGDLAFLRKHLGEAAQWMLPEDDAESSKSYLESLQYNVPKTVKIGGGWLQGDRAILKAEMVDNDGDTQRGLVLLTREDGQWSEQGRDMNMVWD